MIRSYIGLGSNLEQPLEQLRLAANAIKQLDQTNLVASSAIYQNPAVGPGEQPDYLNAVIAIDTDLAAQDLLLALQKIEQQQGRVRTEHWGPRTIDLDILLYGDQVITSESLSVPHSHMRERNFVLYPLHDIDKDLQLPDGTSLASLLNYCNNEGLTKIEQPLEAETITMSGDAV